MKREMIRKRKGRNYITIPAFADRVGVYKSSIYSAIKKGVLTTISFPGEKCQYLDLDVSLDIWAKRKKSNRGTKHTAEIQRTQGGYENIAPFDDDAEVRDFGDVPQIRQIAQVSDGRSIISLQSLDPDAFADCQVYGRNGEPLRNKSTNEPIYNWDLVDKKLKALLHNLQLRTKQSELIPKTDVDYALSVVFQPLMSSISQIPMMYVNRMIATLEERERIRISNETRTVLTAMLQDTTVRIAENFQDAVNGVLRDE